MSQSFQRGSYINYPDTVEVVREAEVYTALISEAKRQWERQWRVSWRIKLWRIGRHSKSTLKS